MCFQLAFISCQCNKMSFLDCNIYSDFLLTKSHNSKHKEKYYIQMKILINVVACGPLGIIKGINDINN